MQRPGWKFSEHVDLEFNAVVGQENMKQLEFNFELPETEAIPETHQPVKRQENAAQIAQPVRPVISEPTVQTSGPAKLEIHNQDLSDPDPFDPRNHKKPQDPRLNPGSDPAAHGLPANIEARKPKKPWFIRIHPDPAYRAVLPLYTDDDSKRREGNAYLFTPGLEIPPDLQDLVRDTLVAAAITSSGIPFLYTLNITDSTWYESGVEVFRLATDEWVRVTPADGCYVPKPPIAKLGEPNFPDVPFRNWLERAFSKRLIKSLDDPLVKKLRGIR
jgi:hypothetical protein